MTAEPDATASPVEVVIEDSRWEVDNLVGLAGRAGWAALDGVGLEPESFEISLLGCDDVRIAELNGMFRGNRKPTNVLSWPSGEDIPEEPGSEPVFLGDIALAWETCASEAEQGGTPFDDHITHLIVHGVLHLLGYDHETDEEAEEMEETEAKILASLGIRNPYE